MSISLDTVINGDCLEIMSQIDTGSIDMILCDLPYGATQNKWDVVISPNLLWQQYERIIKPNGAILLFGQDKFTANPSQKMSYILCIWTTHRKTIPSCSWKSIFPPRTLSCCTTGGKSIIRQH